MKTRVQHLLLSFAILSSFLAGGSLGFAATPAQDACESLKVADSTVTCTAGQKIQDAPKVQSLIKTILNVLSVLVGIVSVIMIIIGGFRYVVSGGDSSSTKGAKDTILYAVIGLVIVLFAQVIVAFVYNKASGA